MPVLVIAKMRKEKGLDLRVGRICLFGLYDKVGEEREIS